MRSNSVKPLLFLVLCAAGGLARVTFPSAPEDDQPAGRIFYVRQTVGSDTADGLGPETAWSSLSMISRAIQAGDTAIVGPGLYRDQILVRASGTAEKPIRLIADPTGFHTGDPPGPVMITGAEPVDESIFRPYSAPGVFVAELTHPALGGVVEMDGDQFRYRNVREPVPDVPYVEVVVKERATFHYDRDAKRLYIHTSDDQPPTDHEIELIRRTGGISITGQHHVAITGFTFRHVMDAGILISPGSSHIMAIDNTSYGNRQGIRVNNSTDVVIAANTLFRNENCGVYLLRESINGQIIDNVLYENAKGIRWSSQSDNGMAVGNVAFHNLEAGISIESTSGALLTSNRLIDNRKSQLLAIKSRFQSEGNCFERGDSTQLTADFYYTDQYESLGEYQQATHQDLASKQDDCGSLPDKQDVKRLHLQTTIYAERARRLLAGNSEPAKENR